jgi:hypothetical protein
MGSSYEGKVYYCPGCDYHSDVDGCSVIDLFPKGTRFISTKDAPTCPSCTKLMDAEKAALLGYQKMNAFHQEMVKNVEETNNILLLKEIEKARKEERERIIKYIQEKGVYRMIKTLVDEDAEIPCYTERTHICIRAEDWQALKDGRG